MDINQIVNYALDGLLILVALISFISGIKKGFFELFFKKLKKLLSLVGAVYFAKQVGLILAENWGRSFLAEQMVNKLDFSSIQVESADDLLNQVQGWIQWIINKVSSTSVEDMANNIFNEGGTLEEMLKAFITDAFSPIADAICILLAGIALYFVFLILISIFTKIFDTIFDLPVLKQINGLLGGVLSVAICAVVIYLLTLLAHLVQDKGWIDGFAEYTFENTYIFKYLWNFSIKDLLFVS